MPRCYPDVHCRPTNILISSGQPDGTSTLRLDVMQCNPANRDGQSLGRRTPTKDVCKVARIYELNLDTCLLTLACLLHIPVQTDALLSPFCLFYHPTSWDTLLVPLRLG